MGLPLQLVQAYTIQRGDDWVQRFELFSDNLFTAALDATVYGTVWTAAVRPSPLSSYSYACSIDSSSASSGVLILTMYASVTATILPADNALGFGIRAATSVGASPTTLVTGKIVVLGDYNHP